RMKKIYEQQQRQYWDRGVGSRELSGRTACIVGAGSIGQGIARRLKAFDLTVLGVKRNAAPMEHFDRVYPVSEIGAALAEADIVIMTAPLTPETEGMFNFRLFSEMKKKPVFVNVGRGKCVVTEDLVAALEQGEIRFAGLDVYETEPLPADSPLRERDDVVLTCHSAYYGEDSKIRQLEWAYEFTLNALNKATLSGRHIANPDVIGRLQGYTVL
ncbi:MAG: hypothetical protein IJE26_07330, partial [Oscillospiraceae bacterium]|nr:hypothetical protein [Oscillospiraceae bacterium]